MTDAEQVSLWLREVGGHIVMAALPKSSIVSPANEPFSPCSIGQSQLLPRARSVLALRRRKESHRGRLEVPLCGTHYGCGAGVVLGSGIGRPIEGTEEQTEVISTVVSRTGVLPASKPLISSPDSVSY